MPRSATFLLAVGGLYGWYVAYKHKLNLGFILNPWLTALWLFIMWVGLSSFWSVVPLDSVKLFLRLCSLCSLGIGWAFLVYSLNLVEFNQVLRSLHLGLLGAALLLIGEKVTGNFWQSWCQKSSAKAFVPLVLTLSIAVWPCLQRYRHTIKTVLFVLILGFVLATVDCDTALVALAFGWAAYSGYLLLPGLAKITTQFIAILILVLPWLLSNVLTTQRIMDLNHSIHSYSYIHRLYVWQFTSDKIGQAWFLGYGADSSRADSIGGENKEWPMVNSKKQPVVIRSRAIPTHPHNIGLQLWLELGLIGTLLGAALHFLSSVWWSGSSRRADAARLGFFIAASTVFWVNLGCWQSWWLATLALLIPLFANRAYDYENLKTSR